MKPGQAMKAAAHSSEERRRRAYDKQVSRLQAQWVPGSELTAAQLAEVQPSLKAQTMERHPEWFGEAA